MPATVSGEWTPRMIGWLLNLAYLVTALAVSPWLLYRAVFTGRYRAGWPEKLLGCVPKDSGAVWFHAVSVGEVLQLRGLITELQARCPDVNVAISTTTHTGLEVARRHFGDDRVFYAPLDFTWAVRRALKRLKPRLLVLVELELWPNLIREASNAGVPVCVVNGRLSDRSFRGYRRVPFLFRPLLQRLLWTAAQNETYAERFRRLGVPKTRVAITGSIKFDGVESNRDNARTRMLRTLFGLTDQDIVWVAGSTHPPEEELLLDVYRQLKPRHPRLRLILAPRHPERCEQIGRMIEAHGLAVLRRSRLVESNQGHAMPESLAGDRDTDTVILLDTVGELAACWGLAQLAFVGGSLAPHRGGQNMIEPAAYGAAVCFGPHTWNFSDVVQMLLAHDAARVVADAGDLARTLEQWLADPSARMAIGHRAARCVRAQAGATRRTVDGLLRLLQRNQSPPHHADGEGPPGAGASSSHVMERPDVSTTVNSLRAAS